VVNAAGAKSDNLTTFLRHCHEIWEPPPPLPGHRPATSWVRYTTSCNTQSSAPEDGRVQHPKHVELIGFVNKQLLVHLVGVYIIFLSELFSPSLCSL